MESDPKVYELATAFVDDVFLSVPPERISKAGAEILRHREALIDRTAQRIQRAIEDECEAIRQELVSSLEARLRGLLE